MSVYTVRRIVQYLHYYVCLYVCVCVNVYVFEIYKQWWVGYFYNTYFRKFRENIL